MKILLIAIILSFGVGLWFGVNIGRGNALYDNPLSDPSVIEDAHESADDEGLIDKGKDFLNHKKEQLKGKAKNMVDDF